MPGSGRSLGEGNSYPLQYSCLENPQDRGAWQTAVHGVAKSQTRLSDFHLLVKFSAVFLASEQMAGLNFILVVSQCGFTSL